MRAATIACALASATLSLCSEQQAPLFGSPKQAPAASDADAPSYRSELLKLHKALVSTESISGAEHDVGEVLSQYLADLGYITQVQPVPPRDDTPANKDRFNVLAWRAGIDHDPTVLLSSHIDVVPPHIPYGIDDGEVTKHTMIRGRGSVDAKGSVAAMIIALDELLKEKKVDPSKLMMLFVVGEEVSGDGMNQFSNAVANKELPYHFESVIFGEPTENKLACGHKGALFCDINAKGFPGHSGYPWLGKSANELMIRAFAKVFETDLGSSELFGKTTVNVGRFNGGVAANVIPAFANVGMGVRVAIGPEESGASIVQEKIEKIFHDISEDAFDLQCTPGYGSVECNCDVDDFDTIVVNYGTDIPNFKGDHTRYLYGPGSILVAHGANENLTVADLETAVEGYQKLILHALKQ
ncbi:acetylornithine deacetylase [Ilyonectria robusta]|uniref:acetylornithine deacetylase n=1 Tax=Ilyonectria robusta TaxID=1079257 RepID=UPI001E8D41DC|nr:acetylornithine deacetylase [Ilyonectria robusta]KAH8736255.1 acetylornithine deacetylase [Ilyonectria robusta]